MKTHAHRFLFLGDLSTSDGATRPVHWCGDCGTAVERFARQVAEVVPEWSRERLVDATYRKRDFSFNEPAWKATSGIGSRLGRGLSDVQRERDAVGDEGLRRLLGGGRR